MTPYLFVTGGILIGWIIFMRPWEDATSTGLATFAAISAATLPYLIVGALLALAIAERV